MIKIELNNIDRIKEGHFSGIKELIIPRAKLFLTAFKVMNAQATVGDLDRYAQLETRTKTSLLGLLVRSKNLLNTKSDYNIISLPSRIKKHYFNNRNNYIQLFNDLCDEKKLRALILADIDNLTTESGNWTKAWYGNLTYKLIDKVIDYDKFNKKKTTPYNAYSLAEALLVNVCPYCNRIYTNTIVTENGKKIVKPTFDHFFLQAKNSFLSLSFYNLIPSCNNCNSYLKGKLEFTLVSHLHPYKEDFGKNAVFDFFFKNLLPDKGHPDNYQILLNVDESFLGNAKISRNIQDFKLREIYQSHADIVGEIAVKTDKASPYYAMALFKSLPSLPTSVKREFYRYYFGNYFDEKDFNKRPLAKLTKDIVGKYLPDLTL